MKTEQQIKDKIEDLEIKTALNSPPLVKQIYELAIHHLKWVLEEE